MSALVWAVVSLVAFVVNAVLYVGGNYGTAGLVFLLITAVAFGANAAFAAVER